MSPGRLFQSFGPTEPNERSPTVTRRDGRTSSWLEVADRNDNETASQQHGEESQTGPVEVQCRAEIGIQGPPARAVTCRRRSSDPWFDRECRVAKCLTQ